jgi:hypothetical protein
MGFSLLNGPECIVPFMPIRQLVTPLGIFAFAKNALLPAVSVRLAERFYACRSAFM